jgi:hypothetical protein
VAVAAADQVEAPAVDGERVRIERVNASGSARAAVVDPQPALLDQPAKNAAIVSSRCWYCFSA